MHRTTKCAVVLLATFWWRFLATAGGVVRNEDICGPHNGRRLYLELGERGVLYARNVTFVGDDARSPAYSAPPPPPPYAVAANGSHRQCSLELVTCPSCVIVATFKSIALPHHCGDGGVVMDSSCRCDYVWLSEPPYEDVSGTPFCGSYAPIAYRSNTRTLSINLLYSQYHKHAFTVEYTAERNRLHLRSTEMTSSGGPKGSNGTGGGILTSPFFPARYPRDLGLEYIITCPGEAPFCRIRLLFSDFQLATVSIMEFYDWKGQRLDVSSGARFRPPVIMSSGPSLLIRFYANGGTGLGYKAFYSFVIGGRAYDNGRSAQPITDCGGYVENLGGAITMMNMVGEGAKTYDCVWLIRPPKNFLHMKTHMYLKVVAFADMAGNTELIVKQGPTSALMSLEVVRHPASQLQPLRHREHIAPVSSGFHVSLRGTFGPRSHLAIAYAAFSYTDCFAGTDFLCQNHRCVPRQLHCDGFDHCGDNSDEPTTCLQNWEEEPRDRKWHMNKANYYFPKIDRYPDLKTATLVFVASSLGLIVLISALIILLYRIGARARQQRELQSRLETISELLDSARIDEISMPDDPPCYEAPPGYEEVAKLIVPKKLPRCSDRESDRSDRSSPNISRDEDANVSARPMTAGASDGDRLLRVPESPPPPYVTPPGTVRKNVMAGLSASMRQICPVRRGWLRRSAQYPQATSSDEASRGPSSSVLVDVAHVLPDAGTFSTENSPSPKEEAPIVRDAVQAGVAETPEKNYDENLARTSSTTVDRSDGRNASCACDGACGCSGLRGIAINDLPISVASINVDEDRDRMIASRKTEEDCQQQQQEQEEEEEAEENRCISKSAIVRLLGTKLATKPSSFYRSASTTATSSPLSDSSPRRCPDESSARTRAGCAAIGAHSGSYGRLRDEFEIVSEAASVATCSSTTANTPCDTPRRARVHRERSGEERAGLNTSCCDLDSLHEGVRILDSYLARRGLDRGPPDRGRERRSAAMTLFGTPWRRSGKSRARLSARVWRSSEDARTSS